jgi:glutamyl-tRNA synthetase
LAFYVHPLPLPQDDKAQAALAQPQASQVLEAFAAVAATLPDLPSPEQAKAAIETVLAQTGLKMGQVGPVLRAALCGTMQSPDLGHVIAALGRETSLARLNH